MALLLGFLQTTFNGTATLSVNNKLGGDENNLQKWRRHPENMSLAEEGLRFLCGPVQLHAGRCISILSGVQS